MYWMVLVQGPTRTGLDLASFVPKQRLAISKTFRGPYRTLSSVSMSSIQMEDVQHLEDLEGPARGFKPVNWSKCDQRVLESFLSKGVPGPPECSTFDGSYIPATETPTVSVCNQHLLGTLPIHIDLRGPNLPMSDVPLMRGVDTPFSTIETSKEGEEGRHNTLNTLGIWTVESEQVFRRRPLTACNADYIQAITRPFDYVMSLPGKNIRSQLLSAFNVWLQVDEKSYRVIDKVTGMLHNASLL